LIPGLDPKVPRQVVHHPIPRGLGELPPKGQLICLLISPFSSPPAHPMQTYLLAICSKEQQKIKDPAINIHTYYIYIIYYIYYILYIYYIYIYIIHILYYIHIIYIYRFYYAFGTLVVAPQLAILEKSLAFFAPRL